MGRGFGVNYLQILCKDDFSISSGKNRKEGNTSAFFFLLIFFC